MRDLGLACLIGVLGAGAIFALGQAICAAGMNPFERAIAASGSTGALVSDQAASRLAPTGFDHTIAGERK